MSVVLSNSLEGAVALVTGARGGIGSAVCAALKAAGARVVATDVDGAPDFKDLRADLWLRHDVTSPAQWTSVVGEVRRQFSRLDCLINNAGISFVESVSDTSLEQWRRVMSVNVESVLLGLQASIPLLKQSGQDRVGGASIVNIASIAGLRGGAFSGAYGASKAALTMLSKSAAKEFATLQYPIRVNSIHPGVVETNMSTLVRARCVEVGIASSIEEQQAVWSAMSPLGRVARPEEIAGAVVFLCAPAASFITGSELVIDGGAIA